MNTLGRGAQKRGPRILNASRGGGGKRGADPLFSILNAVFKMSKKCIFPRRRGKRGSPACQKIAPRGIGGGGSGSGGLAVTECGGRVFARFAIFAIFGPKRPGNGNRGAGRAGRGARGGEKKGGRRGGKNTPREKEKKCPRGEKKGAGRGRPRQPIGSPPHRLIGRTASGLCPTRTA